MHLPLDGKENNELPFKISKTYLHLWTLSPVTQEEYYYLHYNLVHGAESKNLHLPSLKGRGLSL